MTDFSWIRQIRLTIKGLSNTADKIFTADGSMDRLRISARVQKFAGLGDPTQIIVYNLSPETRSGLQRQKTKLILEACWRDGKRGGDWSEVFRGDLMSAETYRSGPEIVTVMNSISGLDSLVRETYQRTWRATSVRSAVVELARCFEKEGITVDEKDIVGIDGMFFEADRCWNATGQVKNSLDRLAHQFRFTWGITDDRFRASSDTKVFGKITTIQGDDLIDVNPKFSTPLQWSKGINFVCKFNPSINPHEGVRVLSSLPENRDMFGHVYKILQLTHDLDSHNSDSFITSGTSFTVPMGK